MNAKKLLYIISRGPYSNATGQEALDAVLIGASFEQKVSVLFMHDGVFQLKSNQDTSNSALKEFTKTYRALDDFGVEHVFCHDLSLTARGLSEADLIRDIRVMSSHQLKGVIAESDRVFTF